MSTTTLPDHHLSGSPLRGALARWRDLAAVGSGWGTTVRLTLGTAALLAAAALAVLTG